MKKSRKENRVRSIDRLPHFRSQMPPSGRNPIFAIINNKKTGYNFQTVHLTHVMCFEHNQETVVKLLNGDDFSDLRRPLATGIDKPTLFTSLKNT
jgi:hypothetical protein